MSLLAKPIQPRQRFHSLATGLPDVDGNKGRFDLPFNVFSTYDPHDDVSDDELQLKNDKSDVEDFDEHEDKQAEKGSRFRRIVRSIILQNRWSKLRQMKVADEGLMTKLREMEDQTNGDILTFNPSSFRSASNTQQELSPQVKFIMCKPTWKRSSSELQIVYKAIDSLMVFKKFSPLIKQELTKVLHYETFGDGRIIIQQGHIGFSLYFVIKGSVAVEVTTTDKVTGKVFKQIVNEILAGGSFGEMALMNGMARSATVICVGQSEFLRIDKSDFHEVKKCVFFLF